MRYEEYLEKLKNAVEKKLGCPIEIKRIMDILIGVWWYMMGLQ